MKHFSLTLLGAIGAFLVISPAQAADFRVIQWNTTRVCQIYNFGWGLRPIPPTYKVLTDAHELAHANDIRRRFADRNVTTMQIVMFGLTGGLIPCPASITILLICLQLQQFTLGAVLVLCFSVGLAITLVTVGAAAALSVRHASKHFSWFGTLAQRAPYLSSALIVLVGLYMGYQGWTGLS